MTTQTPPILEKQDAELLKAQIHVWNHTFSFINSSTLKCAVELNIPDIIDGHDGPITLSELANAIPINASKTDQLGRLMRFLIHTGFFMQTKTGEGKDGYTLAPPSSLLLKRHPSSMRPFLLASNDPVLTRSWHHLGEWFMSDDEKGGPTVFSVAHGVGIWEYMSRDTRFSGLFDDSMESDSRLIMSFVVKYFKGVFEGLGSLVDVGGGNGTAAKIISDAFPELKLTVFDLPHVVRGMGATDSNNNKKLNYIGGDMFVSIPQGDAILLKWILHDWSDEESIKILKKCKESVPNKEEGGKITVIDMVMVMMDNETEGEEEKDYDNNKNNKSIIEIQNFFDMCMMSYCNAKERSEKQWAKLFNEAGFSGYKISPISGTRSIIEIYP